MFSWSINSVLVFQWRLTAAEQICWKINARIPRTGSASCVAPQSTICKCRLSSCPQISGYVCGYEFLCGALKRYRFTVPISMDSDQTKSMKNHSSFGPFSESVVSFTLTSIIPIATPKNRVPYDVSPFSVKLKRWWGNFSGSDNDDGNDDTRQFTNRFYVTKNNTGNLHVIRNEEGMARDRVRMSLTVGWQTGCIMGGGFKNYYRLTSAPPTKTTSLLEKSPKIHVDGWKSRKHTEFV